MAVGTSEAIRQTTISRDGTPIAWWHSGSGPDLLPAHGTTADHTRWRPCCRCSSRGPPCMRWTAAAAAAAGTHGYSLAAEADDVAAVVETIGRPVDVFGHSYGALVALEAALRSRGVRRLVLYEPALGTTTFPEETARMERSLAAGRREDVIVIVLRDLAGMTEEQLAVSRSLPSWEGRVAAAHTVVRETRAEEALPVRPGPLQRIPGADPPAAREREPAVAAGGDRRRRRLGARGPGDAPDRPWARGDAVGAATGGGCDPRVRPRGSCRPAVHHSPELRGDLRRHSSSRPACRPAAASRSARSGPPSPATRGQ